MDFTVYAFVLLLLIQKYDPILCLYVDILLCIKAKKIKGGRGWVFSLFITCSVLQGYSIFYFKRISFCGISRMVIEEKVISQEYFVFIFMPIWMFCKRFKNFSGSNFRGWTINSRKHFADFPKNREIRENLCIYGKYLPLT